MSKINPEPNLIHIMGCYVLGNPNGEKVRLRSGIGSLWVWLSGSGTIPAFLPLTSGFGSDPTDGAVTEFVFLFLSGPTALPETEEPDEALFCGV